MWPFHTEEKNDKAVLSEGEEMQTMKARNDDYVCVWVMAPNSQDWQEVDERIKYEEASSL